MKILKFGESDVKSYIPGSEVVEKKIDGDDKDEDGEDWVEDSGEEDEEGESDDEWNDVSHSSDEEGVLVESEKKEDPVEEKQKITKAIEASSERIFTQEDFKKIQQEQLRKKVQLTSKDAAKRKAISIEEDSDEEEDTK